MDERGDRLIRDARTAAEFLRESGEGDPSRHDTFVAGLLERLADQLEACRKLRAAGAMDDGDLIRQLEAASRECDSALHEMAALRLRTALGRH